MAMCQLVNNPSGSMNVRLARLSRPGPIGLGPDCEVLGAQLSLIRGEETVGGLLNVARRRLKPLLDRCGQGRQE